MCDVPLLIRRLLEPSWADDFLVLQPPERLVMTYDQAVVRAVEAEALWPS